MRISILGIGNEVIKGKTVNTNASFISKELNKLGFDIKSHLVVKDYASEIKSALTYLYSHSDLVITTGGLGPTVDDLTRESIAEFFNEALVVNEEIVNQIESYFKQSGREMPKTNIKQARYPKLAEVIINKNGTAPGMYFEKNNQTIIMLPGPPRELNPMFLDYVIPKLRMSHEPSTVSKLYRTMGIGESHAEEMLEPLYKKFLNVEIAPYASVGSIDFILTVDKSVVGYENELNKASQEFENIMTDFIIGDQSKFINEHVVDLLKNKGLTLGIAESCTGGLLSSMIVDVPGSSSALLESCITYSNEAKVLRLSVKEETLNVYGAVSKETAEEMSKGITQLLNTDVGLSVTGIAGPTGGTKEKPVGLVYMAITIHGNTDVYKYNFKGSRKKIRTQAALTLLHTLYKKLKEIKL
ncbi:competence/damage-inducible protein A [Haloplasma contractile]|uniref:CinA-like protein n=1 Tax=Haloplasma contractile SSD-17B TaxID=1033810 RepID=U2FMC0_9MOLU|nr:competence/damage-inducible protein A [Haloplasma contractile]ERJ12319.1 FAD synthetase protein [Haloplasma contractile SSD-17B]